MLTKEDGRLDFTQSAAMVAGRCRGVTPWPGAYGFLDGQRLKLFDPRVREGSGAPGQVLQFDKNGMVIACGSGALEVLEMQAPGAKRMNSKAYLMGKNIPVGTIFSRERNNA